MRTAFRLIKQPDQIKKAILEPVIRTLIPGAKIIDFQVISDLDKPDNKFEFNVSYTAENYGKFVDGAIVIEAPLNKPKASASGGFGEEIMKALKELQSKERKYPMMNIPVRSEDIIHLRVPPDSVLIIPENKTIKTEIVSYECNFEKLSDAELIIRSSQTVNVAIMEPEEYSELLGLTLEFFEFTPEIEIRSIDNRSIIERVLILIKDLISRLLSPLRSIGSF
ncbi:MAG: hypothetical protein MOIL_01703 [Candidatus Methanolliviera sp. GoM_oil]|nr:MAG: hypothetical protein MOIL_01703 [Candidatus Methanolliviera sp. GoM_oil]